MAVGKVRAIRGVVVDVEFPAGELPEIYESLEIQRPEGRLVLEGSLVELQQSTGYETLVEMFLHSIQAPAAELELE